MSIRVLFKIISFTSIFLLLILGCVAILMLRNLRSIDKSQETRYRAYLAADEMRENYSKLTLYARNFVITGESIWEQRYNRLLAITKGEKLGPDKKSHHWRKELEEFGFTAQELTALEKSEERWKDLLEIERQALHAMKGIFQDKDGNYTIKKKPDPELARKLLFNDTYRGFKILAMNPIEDFVIMLNNRTENQVRHFIRNSFQLMILTYIILFICIIFNIFLFWLLSRRLIRPIMLLKDKLFQASSGDFSVQMPVRGKSEIAILGNCFNSMVQDIKKLLDDSVKEQKNRMKAELKVMQAQINPHFLYNTLDTIVWMAEGKNHQRVIDLANSLSNLFRITLSKGKEWITLQEEIEHVRCYLNIQKIRYEDILDFSIRYSEELKEKKILKLVIQPLVENALYHGIKGKRGRGHLDVSILPNNGNEMLICVSDNGVGMDNHTLEEVLEEMNSYEPIHEDNKIGFGLKNVNQRLKLYYGKNYGICLESEYKKGTKVLVSIPLKN